MLTLFEFFDATHEKKNQKGSFWTPEAANRMRVPIVILKLYEALNHIYIGYCLPRDFN